MDEFCLCEWIKFNRWKLVCLNHILRIERSSCEQTKTTSHVANVWEQYRKCLESTLLVLLLRTHLLFMPDSRKRLVHVCMSRVERTFYTVFPVIGCSQTSQHFMSKYSAPNQSAFKRRAAPLFIIMLSLSSVGMIGASLFSIRIGMLLEFGEEKN